MTDLEMTKACAEAAEVWKYAHELYPTMTLDPTFSGVEIRGHWVMLVPNNPMRQDPQEYNPLQNDVQAMDLVKRLHLDIEPCFDGDGGEWMVSTWSEDNSRRVNVCRADDLNRAIVECVAKMHSPT